MKILKGYRQQQADRTVGHCLPLAIICFLLLSMSGCSQFFQPNPKKTIVTKDGEKIDMNDATVRQYVEEWANAKPSVDRLSEMENDLVFLLGEVSKMSDLGQVPGLAGNPQQATTPSNPNQPLGAATQLASPPGAPPATQANTLPSTNTGVPTSIAVPANVANQTSAAPMAGAGNQQPNGNPMGATTFVQVPATTTTQYLGAATTAFNNPNNFLCPEPFGNSYKKAIAFTSFPRAVPLSSNLGALHQVEQHLPMLIGANLRNRHSLLTPTYLRETFAGAGTLGELNAATQAQSLAKQHRVQFFITGMVDDMTLTFPNSVEKPSYYTRFVSGAHNFFNINTPLDKRSRIFSFTLEVRDGFTGQIIFSHQYQTFGKWKASSGTKMGFGSPQFWETDYGIQVQHLVARASNDLAGAINCQPYMARVDSSPGQQQIVIHSGTNNGLHSGDTLDLYQLVYQPITGEYQRFDTRMVKRNGRVYLTEIYPSHSIGHVVDETLLSGQYLVKAR